MAKSSIQMYLVDGQVLIAAGAVLEEVYARHGGTHMVLHPHLRLVQNIE